MRLDQDRKAHSAAADFPALAYQAWRALLCVVALLPTLLIWGCSGIVSGQSSSPSPSPQTYSISGTISPTTGGSGATVTLSGPASATTTANSSGNYTFAGLLNGTYAVTPSRAGYTLSPSTQGATVNGANVSGVNFTATAQAAAVGHTVALTWNASSSTISGYNIYRSTVSGIGFARINSSLVAALSFTDSNVLNGTTYYYVTTAVDAAGVESTFSNEATAVIP